MGAVIAKESNCHACDSRKRSLHRGGGGAAGHRFLGQKWSIYLSVDNR
jgi:hypothetical protein